jgi:hypothetical protein
MSALSDKCTEIYQTSRDGQRAVEEFVRKNHIGVPWGYCTECEAMEPYDTDNACLVCASVIAEGT